MESIQTEETKWTGAQSKPRPPRKIGLRAVPGPGPGSTRTENFFWIIEGNKIWFVFKRTKCVQSEYTFKLSKKQSKQPIKSEIKTLYFCHYRLLYVSILNQGSILRITIFWTSCICFIYQSVIYFAVVYYLLPKRRQDFALSSSLTNTQETQSRTRFMPNAAAASCTTLTRRNSANLCQFHGPSHGDGEIFHHCEALCWSGSCDWALFTPSYKATHTNRSAAAQPQLSQDFLRTLLRDIPS